MLEGLKVPVHLLDGPKEQLAGYGFGSTRGDSLSGTVRVDTGLPVLPIQSGAPPNLAAFLGRRHTQGTANLLDVSKGKGVAH